MLTWFRLWPLLLLPTVLLMLGCSMPWLELRGRIVAGALLRQGLLNHIVLPLTPAEQGGQLVNWFTAATPLQEWLLALLISLNLNALLLPLLYALGHALIIVSGWYVRTELEHKRKAVR